MRSHTRGNSRGSRNDKQKAAATGSLKDVTRWLGTDEVGQLRDTLRQAGVEFSGPSSGQIVAEDFAADVQLDPDDLIRVRCDVDLTESPHGLLQRFAGAVGNVRYGLGSMGLQLAAETRVDGVSHLPHSLGEIRNGFSLGIRPGELEVPETPEEDVSASIRAAVEQSPLPTDDAVETAEGYELQPRFEGSRVAVQVVSQPGAALVQRTVVSALPNGVVGAAVAHQSLVWNARLCCCRLAVSDGKLFVESRLHAERIDSEWLSFTVRAVAAAARSVEPELDILVREPDISQAYVDMFGLASSQEPNH